MLSRTDKPRLTLGRAILIKLLSKYRELNYGLSRIEVQKLCYFAKEAGEVTFSKLTYKKEKFGPYADKLRHVLNAMEGHYIQGVGDHDTSQQDIVLCDNALEEATEFLNNHPDINNRIEKVSQLIEGFETPYGMELLATVHWLVSNDKLENDSEHILSGVQLWNERKKELFSQRDIEIALNRLNTHNWIH